MNKTYVWLILIFALAFAVRVFGQLDRIFPGNDIVLFRETDPYLHMRLAENIAANFPHIMKWDYYAMFPDGANTYSPVLAFTVATVSWIIGLGHPVTQLVDTVGVWLPPVFAGLTCIVVYFLVMEVFKSRFVAVFSAVILALLPTEFFHRSLLGFVDHHVLEVLFITACLLFTIKATRTCKWYHIAPAVACGGLYALNWVGWYIMLPLFGGWFYGYYAVYRNWNKHRRLSVTLLILPFVIILATLPIARVQWLWWNFLSYTFLGFTGTIVEANPPSFYVYYCLYGIAGFLCFLGLYVAIRNKVHGLFIVWSVFFLFAMIMQKRWGYYGAVPVSIFSAYAIWKASHNVNKNWKTSVLIYTCIAVIIFSCKYSLDIAKLPVDISSDWYNACVWMKHETPEPFNSDDYLMLDPEMKPEYGVFSWWDYGHWIIQIGHRVPVSSPTQQESAYYGFYTAQNEEEANQIIDGLNIKYVMVSQDMAAGKYFAIWNKVNPGSNEVWQKTIPGSMSLAENNTG